MRTRLALLGVLFAVFTLLLGCSGQGIPGLPNVSLPGSSDPKEDIRKAAEAMRDAGSVRYESSSTLGGQGGSSLKVTGAFDFGKKLGEARVEGFGPDAALVITDGTTAYVQMPGQRHWFKSQLGELGVSPDVGKQIELLADMDGIREVGTVDVRGVSTRHIAGSMDLQKVLSANGIPLQTLGAPPSGTAEVSIYLDSDGLLRRLEVTMPNTGPWAGTTTTDYFDYGADVSIQVPDPSQVQEFTLPGMGGR